MRDMDGMAASAAAADPRPQRPTAVVIRPLSNPSSPEATSGTAVAGPLGNPVTTTTTPRPHPHTPYQHTHTTNPMPPSR